MAKIWSFLYFPSILTIFNNFKLFLWSHSKLGYFVNTMRRLVEHKIDRPNTQCKLIARMRKTYFQLNILRRNCSKKYGKNQSRQDVKRALKAKKEARAIKQAQREEKKRNKRGKIWWDYNNEYWHHWRPLYIEYTHTEFSILTRR